jgi:hypothetical protein
MKWNLSDHLGKESFIYVHVSFFVVVKIGFLEGFVEIYVSCSLFLFSYREGALIYVHVLWI